MPEKPCGDHVEVTTREVKFEREITQTDKLNKRLLASCLQFINSDKNNHFSVTQTPDKNVKEQSENRDFEQPILSPSQFDTVGEIINMMEDIFSEELVDTPDDIERVIEGDVDEIQHGSGRESGNEDEKNENDNAKDTDKVKVKRKLGPRPTLNAQRLKGPRGIGIMESFFSDINLKGKGKEKEDLDIVMGRLEHWAHRLFPRMKFDDALQKIEKLGNKKEVSNYVKRIRLGLEDDEVVDARVEDEAPESPPPVDTFDQLMASVVPVQPAATEMTEEQRERMLQNRLIAEERRNARLKRAKELKEKFQAQQAQSQNEHSQTLETEERGTNGNNDASINNQAELEMEIDENTIPENSFKFDGERDNSLINRSNEPDLEIERNGDLTERHDNNVSQEDEQEVPMEGVDNCPDILLESNNRQLDFSQGPDVVQRNSVPRVSDGNQPDILSNQKNLPDILVGRNEMEGNGSQDFEELVRLNENTDGIEESYDRQLEIRENQPDILQ